MHSGTMVKPNKTKHTSTEENSGEVKTNSNLQAASSKQATILHEGPTMIDIMAVINQLNQNADSPTQVLFARWREK